MEQLTVEQAAEVAPHTLGEMAHIKGKNKGSNRYDAKQSNIERDDYENLILLCPNHHTLIDKKQNEQKYSVELLLEMKVQHEAKITNRLSPTTILNIDDLKTEISIFLTESHQSWLHYGPNSENAQRNPNSETLHALWLSERLTTIIPNNRTITKLINKNRKFFKRSDQLIISQFMSHVESYEKWVADKIPYQAVIRFPQKFEELIMEG
ncbi:HNH endonuclease signature motif containing protein [Pseudomonas yamanorum]|uniref:HNH endonuclease signature motif containing protein n=1 Tax=Pseudomonas yamanorum TaxID=515393 RepID=A0ABU1D118_9PSED|nr:HNH endonuclease signature motif containing protein [Pseudomonas yamanorum]MDR0193189.1 HNH endonuclease signature motif containing protein [Pseudomonas yamanorum]